MGEASRKQKLDRKSLWTQVSLPLKRAGLKSANSQNRECDKLCLCLGLNVFLCRIGSLKSPLNMECIRIELSSDKQSDGDALLQNMQGCMQDRGVNISLDKSSCGLLPQFDSALRFMCSALKNVVVLQFCLHSCCEHYTVLIRQILQSRLPRCEAIKIQFVMISMVQTSRVTGMQKTGDSGST